MKNPKKIFEGFFKRRKPQKAGLGWQPQQDSHRTKFASLFLLLLILQRAFLPAFAKMTPDAVVSTRCWRNPFSLPSTTGKCSKCQTSGRKNSLLAYYYNRQVAKWPGAEPDNKKSSKSFSRLTAFAGRTGGGWYSVFMACRAVRQAGT